MSEARIQVREISRSFGETEAVRGVSLEIREGEIIVLLGPSGCGKTTLLRLIAGFETPDGGSITIRGREVCGPGGFVPPEKRSIGFVFQDYALFPHYSVAGNVGYGVRKRSRAERNERIAAALRMVGLEELGDRMPHELSGGQRQRVALARALAPDPDVILLDEPFSNLDASLRRQVREELHAILRKAGTTAVFVTHDQEEALNLGDRVAVMHAGRLLEYALPRDVYLHPATPEAARIVGSANFLPGESTGVTVRCALGQLPLARPCRTGGMMVMLRPESILLTSVSPVHGRKGAVVGEVRDLQYHGNHQHIGVRLESGEDLVVKVGPERFFQTGQAVIVRAPDPVVCYESA